MSGSVTEGARVLNDMMDKVTGRDRLREMGERTRADFYALPSVDTPEAAEAAVRCDLEAWAGPERRPAPFPLRRSYLKDSEGRFLVVLDDGRVARATPGQTSALRQLKDLRRMEDRLESARHRHSDPRNRDPEYTAAQVARFEAMSVPLRRIAAELVERLDKGEAGESELGLGAVADLAPADLVAAAPSAELDQKHEQGLYLVRQAGVLLFQGLKALFGRHRRAGHGSVSGSSRAPNSESRPEAMS